MKNYVWALILGIGVALSGYFIYCGIEKIANKDRHVTVKGLSEREVMADKVTWSLSYNVAGNALEFLYESLEPKQDKLIKFLKSNGVKEDEIFLDVPSAEDRSSWYNWNEKKDVMARFVVTGRLTIVSSDVEKIMTLRMKQLDLLKQGVLLDNSYCSYEYTGLNDLKPEMVEEATKNARIVAQKFAHASWHRSLPKMPEQSSAASALHARVSSRSRATRLCPTSVRSASSPLSSTI